MAVGDITFILPGLYLPSMKQTTRDQLWNATLKRTHRDGNSITAPQLSETFDCSERTARDLLHTMADWNFLESKSTERETEFVASEEAFSEVYTPE